MYSVNKVKFKYKHQNEYGITVTAVFRVKLKGKDFKYLYFKGEFLFFSRGMYRVTIVKCNYKNQNENVFVDHLKTRRNE